MPERSPSTSAPRGRILLAAGTANGRSARKAILEELGHRVTVAANGEEALERFAESPFDLVVTDCKLPRVDGPELVQRLRKQRAHVPVILISAYAESLGMSDAATGADVVLLKSNNEVAHLTRAVARLLKKPARKRPASEPGPSKPRRRSG